MIDRVARNMPSDLSNTAATRVMETDTAKDDRVALIALAYNHAKYLPQLFDSIWVNIADIAELVLIDNGSSDGSESMMREFVKTLPEGVRSTVQRNPPRTVPTTAVNLALRSVNSMLVAVTSGDDFLLPGRFTAQLAAMRRCPELVFCYSNGYVCNEAGTISGTPLHDSDTLALLQSTSRTISKGLYYPVPTIFTQCGLFKRAALLDIGGWDEDLVIDDWPLNIKLFSKFGDSFQYVNAFVAAYRRHDTNASKRRFRQYMGQKRVLRKYATGENLQRGLSALYASQCLASVKRKQWWRTRSFSNHAMRSAPRWWFLIQWFTREATRRLLPNKIR